MKNKFTLLILALIANLHFANTAYSQTPQDNFYESYSEAQDFDCDTTSAYRYVTLGTGPVILIPNLGIGYRQRYSQFGWDTALSFSTIGYAHQLSGHVVGHYYLSPSRQNSAYLGLGLIGSGIIFNDGKCNNTTLSPDFVFGKELKKNGNSKHFIEMHLAIPTILMDSRHSKVLPFPFMYIKYGISF